MPGLECVNRGTIAQGCSASTARWAMANAVRSASQSSVGGASRILPRTRSSIASMSTSLVAKYRYSAIGEAPIWVATARIVRAS